MNDSVQSTMIAAGAVTALKIGTNAVIAAKLSAGSVIAAKLGAAAVTPSKISANYQTFVIPFMYSGAGSGAAATRQLLHYFSQPATVVGMWFAHSGLAAGPTAKATFDCHVVKAIGSAAASANSIYRTAATKLTSVSTPQAIAYKATSGVVSGAAGAILYVERDKHGSAVGSTKMYGAVVLKQRLRY